MKKNNIEGLREVLFDTIRKVQAGTIETEKAKIINDLCQTGINSAKVEVDFMRYNKGKAGTDFMLAKEIIHTPEIADSKEDDALENLTVEQEELLALQRIKNVDNSYAKVGGKIRMMNNE